MDVNRQQFATKAGLSVEFVDRLTSLQLLPPDDGLEERHLPVARLAAGLEESGVSTERLAELVADGALSLDYINRSFVRAAGMQE